MGYGPLKEVWYKPAHLKVQFFLWNATLEKISTMEMPRKKGSHHSRICLHCDNSNKSCSHLLLQCPYAWEIWCGISHDFGLGFTTPPNLYTLLEGWRTEEISEIGRQIWRLVAAAVCGSLWLEHKHRVFEDNAKPSYRVYKRARDQVLL